MIQETELSSLLFFDLETSSEYSSFEELTRENPRKAELWKTKADKAQIKDPERWKDYSASYAEQSPLVPEFGRIVCASFCHLSTVSVEGKMQWKGKMKSFIDTERSSTSEAESILKPVSQLLYNIDRAGKSMRLCGHNIKKFDVPWLSKKMITNRVLVPVQLQTWGKKPWEITHLDTSELWAFGNWDGYVSLDLMSCTLEIPSPKSVMSGEYVGKTFWVENDLEKIKNYCEEDVKCVARICHRLSTSELPIQF